MTVDSPSSGVFWEEYGGMFIDCSPSSIFCGETLQRSPGNRDSEEECAFYFATHSNFGASLAAPQLVDLPSSGSIQLRVRGSHRSKIITISIAEDMSVEEDDPHIETRADMGSQVEEVYLGRILLLC